MVGFDTLQESRLRRRVPRKLVVHIERGEHGPSSWGGHEQTLVAILTALQQVCHA
ncbi:hypothetical protein HQ560_19415 [bacterium]|nr:hypothetical protein [bacterium]